MPDSVKALVPQSPFRKNSVHENSAHENLVHKNSIHENAVRESSNQKNVVRETTSREHSLREFVREPFRESTREHVRRETLDSFPLGDSIRLSKCPGTVFYSEQYVYPEFKCEGIDAIPYNPIDFVEKPSSSRPIFGFLNTEGFNFSIQLLLLLYFFYSLRGKFERTLQAFWSSSKLERYYNEKELRNPAFFWTVYWSLSLSMTLPILKSMEGVDIVFSYVHGIPHSIWELGAYIVLFHLLYFTVAYLFFGITRNIKHFGFWLLARASVMWVVAILFTLMYGMACAFDWSVAHTTTLFLLVYVLGYMKFLNHTYYMVKERGFSISVWILYLCALELFPMIAFLSVSWDVFTR